MVNFHRYHHADVITWEKIVREADQGTQKKMIFSTEYQNPKHEANAQDYVSLSDLREATLEHVMVNMEILGKTNLRRL